MYRTRMDAGPEEAPSMSHAVGRYDFEDKDGDYVRLATQLRALLVLSIRESGALAESA
jgi:hypothetical protein